MRILICSQPGHGHLCLVQPLADSLQGDGHEITVASAPRFAGAAAAMGFGHTPVGIDWLESELDETFPGARAATNGVSIEADVFAGATAAAALPHLQRYVEQSPPDLMVRTAWEFASCVVAARNDIPLVSMNPTLFGRRVFNRTFGKPLTRLVGRRVRAYEFVHRFPSVLTTPSSFVLERETVPPNTQWCSPRPQTAVPAPRNKRPLVHVSLGTVVHRPGLYQMVLDSLAPVDCDVIVAAPVEVTARLRGGPNVELRGFVDHATLLPRCDLFVHHGGIGSVLASLDNHTPVVVLPGWADQPRNAYACAQMGIGVPVPLGQQDEATIRAAIESVLQNSGAHRTAFQRLSDELAARPELSSAVHWIAAAHTDRRLLVSARR